ncbi:hypothetical protein J2T22_000619 [Pseudarthrobacter defluvii]|uniref:AAA domain-containing protein n=1 Tax=Pseudarthrobacter defluvii TaxID=410837 RepID=A0ABT9UG85_9MICC|nr:AAA family ATPase [Pseudarthrobacter defluvii]MDQ0117449.1 hypothetical protein [Pseudarthrobacter defluvii]
MTYAVATAPDPLDGVFAADWLTKQVLPAVEYVVPGVIPEGLTILVAPPKIGKSWMVLGLGVAAATGDLAFGSIPVDARPVLYLALEDGARRLQSRLRTIGVTAGPRGLFFMTEVPAGPLATIATFLDRNAEHKPLVILDTLGKVRGTYGGNDAYGNDYSQMSQLKDLVDRHPGSSLIVVHHTNKGEKSDFLDSVSGTQGLAGAADSILLIQRDRQTESSTLHVTSRDAKEGQYSLHLSDGVWKLDGSSLREASEALRIRSATEGVGDDMAELVKVVSRYPEGMKPKDVASLLHWEDGKTRLYLRRACESGRIANPKRGLYAPVTTETTVTIPFGTPDESITSYESYTPEREAS